MALVEICSLKKFNEKKKYTIWVDQLNDEIHLFKENENIVAVSSVCPHFGGPLDSKESSIFCSWHGWEFGKKDGQCLNRKVKTKLNFYSVIVENDKISIKL